jgi:hypothetical protein
VHVLPDDEYRRLFVSRLPSEDGEPADGNPGVVGQGGFEMFGHVFLPEAVRADWDTWTLTVTHELAHATGFLGVRFPLTADMVRTRAAVCPGLARSGLMLVADDDAQSVTFKGLNEVVTEYCALMVREYVARSPVGDFGASCARYASAAVSYTPLFRFFMELFRQLAGGRVGGWSHPVDVWQALVTDYFGGTDVFVDALALAGPAAHRAVRDLGSDSAAFARAVQLAQQRWFQP